MDKLNVYIVWNWKELNLYETRYQNIFVGRRKKNCKPSNEAQRFLEIWKLVSFKKISHSE